jgi:hypothetical protein
MRRFSVENELKVLGHHSRTFSKNKSGGKPTFPTLETFNLDRPIDSFLHLDIIDLPT